jgi:hypothetical protein
MMRWRVCCDLWNILSRIARDDHPMIRRYRNQACAIRMVNHQQACVRVTSLIKPADLCSRCALHTATPTQLLRHPGGNEFEAGLTACMFASGKPCWHSSDGRKNGRMTPARLLGNHVCAFKQRSEYSTLLTHLPNNSQVPHAG